MDAPKKIMRAFFISERGLKEIALDNLVFCCGVVAAVACSSYLDLFERNPFENILFEKSRHEILQSRIDMVSSGHITGENRLLSWDNIEQLKLCVCDKRASAIHKTVQSHSQSPDVDSLCDGWPRWVNCGVDGQDRG